MLLAMQHAAELPPIVREELEQLIGAIQTAFNTIDVGSIIAQATNAASIHRGTLALAPTTLGLADAGYLYFVSDYGHLCRWTGTVWEFAPGDVGNGFHREFLIAPQEVGWQLMDGTANVTYLVVGGVTLTTLTKNMPNLTGSPAYHKSIAAFTGAITAAIAPGASSTAPAISGSTANESTHTHDSGTLATGDDNSPSGGINYTPGGTNASVAGHTHQHPTGGWSGATGAGAAHNHGAGTLAASAPAITVDATGEPAHIGWLPYFRR